MCQTRFTEDAKVETAEGKLRENQKEILLYVKEEMKKRQYDPGILKCVGIEELVLIGPDTYRQIYVIISESVFTGFVVWMLQALGRTLRGEVFSLEKQCGDTTVMLHVYAY